MDSMSRLALLQALIAGPGYGLELIDRVRSRTNGQIVLRNGSVYPTLRDMERDGLIASYEVAENPQERGGRPRRYYKLTALGATAAQEQRAAVRGLLSLRPAEDAR